MELVFVYDKKLGSRFVPNGLVDSGPFYRRFLRAEGEYGEQGYCHSPLLHLLASFNFAFDEVLIDSLHDSQNNGEVLSSTSRFYALEMIYSPHVWIPDRQGQDSSLSPWLHIGPEALAGIQSGKLTLLITHLKRPERDAYALDLFTRLFSKLEELQIPFSNVIFLGASNDTIRHYQSARESRGGDDQFRAVLVAPYFEWGWHSFFERYQREGRIYSRDQAAAEIRRVRTKRFLCFNREPRAHRLIHALWLQKESLLSQGLVSFPADGDHFEYKKFNPYHEGVIHIFSDRDILLLAQQLDAFRQQTPLLVDHPDLNQLHVSWCEIEPFRESYFSILTERLFHNPRGQMLLTAKTYKALCNMHPFILIGPYLGLQQWRSMGYQSFSPWIDESYDLEPNPNLRIKMIWTQVRRLCDMPIADLQNWYRELFPILEFNLNHYQKRNAAGDLGQHQRIGRLVEKMTTAESGVCADLSQD